LLGLEAVAPGCLLGTPENLEPRPSERRGPIAVPPRQIRVLASREQLPVTVLTHRLQHAEPAAFVALND
jgi:hypothetical protein